MTSEHRRKQCAAAQARWRKNHPEEYRAQKSFYQTGCHNEARDRHAWLEEACDNLKRLRQSVMAKARCERSKKAYEAHFASLPAWAQEATAFLAKRHRQRSITRGTIRWHKRHPEVGRLSTAVYRAKTRGSKVITKITPSMWVEQLEVFGNRCAYCIRLLIADQLDHVWPVSRGGEHSIDNAVPACGTCNRRKGGRGPLAMVNIGAFGQ